MAPLDWGLGHATRCIPIIRELLAAGAEPWIAGEGICLHLLREDFPGLHYLPLKGYRISYPKKGKNLSFWVLNQLPKIQMAIRNERKWLQKMHLDYQFDGVISDNRYGLFHPEIPSIFITHQLKIKSGLGFFADYLVNIWNYRQINRFSQCWIPDTAGEMNLSGALSHCGSLPREAKFIGPLSRFRRMNTQIRYGLVIVLSGPEPLRSELEKKLLEQISLFPPNSLLVRGLPDEAILPKVEGCKIVNHLNSGELNEALAAAEYIICRSGYSSIMDLVQLGKKMILVATPGQPEQEYLAKWMEANQMAIIFNQDDFSIPHVLEKSARSRNPLNFPVPDSGALGFFIRKWLQTC